MHKFRDAHRQRSRSGAGENAHSSSNIFQECVEQSSAMVSSKPLPHALAGPENTKITSLCLCGACFQASLGCHTGACTVPRRYLAALTHLLAATAGDLGHCSRVLRTDQMRSAEWLSSHPRRPLVVPPPVVTGARYADTTLRWSQSVTRRRGSTVV